MVSLAAGPCVFPAALYLRPTAGASLSAEAESGCSTLKYLMSCMIGNGRQACAYVCVEEELVCFHGNIL